MMTGFLIPGGLAVAALASLFLLRGMIKFLVFAVLAVLAFVMLPSSASLLSGRTDTPAPIAGGLADMIGLSSGVAAEADQVATATKVWKIIEPSRQKWT